jgi:hypothetical protein
MNKDNKIYEMLKYLCLNFDKNIHFSYFLENNIIIGYGLINQFGYLTNYCIGEIPYNIYKLKDNQENTIIDFNNYTSVVLIEQNSNLFMIWSNKALSDKNDLLLDKSDKIFNLTGSEKLNKQNIDNIIIYGLKNKLLFQIDFFNNIEIDYEYIKKYIDVWFNYNHFNIICIYKNKIIDKYLFKYEEVITLTDNTDDDDSIIDIFINNDNKNNLLKEYIKTNNIIIGSETDNYNIVTKFIKNNQIDLEKYNICFKYHYPIILYSN